MPKGCKTCSSCGYCTGPRAYACPQCHAPFAFKVQSKEKKNTKIIKDFHWRELVAGDKIKVTGGPYYMNRDQEFVECATNEQAEQQALALEKQLQTFHPDKTVATWINRF